MDFQTRSIYTLFSKSLIQWGKKNDRQMPWKKETNPYYIWISEIILQQTRVEQGMPYFEDFVKNFPSISDLANASEDKIFKHWQGLGYYSRARNLHFTAKFITENLNGHFPDSYEEIRKLKGVGDYTAAAIASFAFNLPHAVVDGNVYRVLSRIFGIETPIDKSVGKKIFQQLATELLDKKAPGEYNQAIMDFGATHCKPKNPLCSTCPFSDHCIALTEDKIALLPVKTKKIKKKTRFFHYLMIQNGDSTYITRRSEKDIWQGLYQFPMIEKTNILPANELIVTPEWKKLFGNQKIEIQSYSKNFKQTLSHQYINAVFLVINLSGKFSPDYNQIIEIEKKNVNKFAFPKIITWFLSDKTLYLNFN